MNPDDTRLQYVRVTNGLDVPFIDRYDGVPYTIKAHSSLNLPPDVAAHFFGTYADPEMTFRHVCKRQGWNTLEFLPGGKTPARELFDKLQIQNIMYKLVPVEEPDPRKPVPADPAVPGEVDAADRRRPGRPRQQGKTDPKDFDPSTGPYPSSA